jgi:prepilin-type N-terminal cleavage/methylation domain-containing protein
MKKINPTKKGFTLVETLIAIAVLSLALIPPIYTAYQSVISANYARDQMIGSYLAQDAMDYIIAKKNQNLLACYDGGNGPDPKNDGTPADDKVECDQNDNQFGRDWLADLGVCDATSDLSIKCTIDTTRRNVTNDPYAYTFANSCVAGTDPSCYMYFDTQRNQYRPYDIVKPPADQTYIQPTKFKRFVSYVKRDDVTGAVSTAGTEAAVTVTVSWKSSGFNSTDSVVIRSNIFKFKP